MKPKNIIAGIKKHKRLILTIVTIAGEAVAIYEAIKNGPTFEKVLEDCKKKKEAGEKIDVKAVAKELAIPAAKVVGPFAVSVTATVINSKDHKEAIEAVQTLTTLYSATKTGYEEYKKATKEVVGEETEKEIESATYKEKCFSDMKTGQLDQVYHTGHGVTKFFDAWSGRYFISDANYIKKVMNDCNQRLMVENYLSLNEFYEDLDLQPIDGGKDLGWNSEYGLIDLYIDYVSDEGDQPLGIIKFINAPSWRYHRW